MNICICICLQYYLFVCFYFCLCFFFFFIYLSGLLRIYHAKNTHDSMTSIYVVQIKLFQSSIFKQKYQMAKDITIMMQVSGNGPEKKRKKKLYKKWNDNDKNDNNNDGGSYNDIKV